MHGSGVSYPLHSPGVGGDVALFHDGVPSVSEPVSGGGLPDDSGYPGVDLSHL